MQAVYPEKLQPASWDTLNLSYPVKRFPQTEISAITTSHEPRGNLEVLKQMPNRPDEYKQYDRDYNITKKLTRSQSALDYGQKPCETKRFNKHTSLTENRYINETSRKFLECVPRSNEHGVSEMKSKYTTPIVPAGVVSNNNSNKCLNSLFIDPYTESSCYKELEPLDTTHEGFEKYLDPYLTTSRLHHRPFTAEQLSRPSNTRDIATYHTYNNIPWVRSPKPNIEKWNFGPKMPQTVYDREKFKQGTREIITHNKLNWIPRSFRTETRDNYSPQNSRPESRIYNFENDVRSYYKKRAAKLKTNSCFEDIAIKDIYKKVF